MAGKPILATRLINLIDQITDFSGRAVAWLSLAMVLLTCTVVLLRYGLNIGSIAAQEAINYLHAALFMLGAAMTLQRNGHVRVDIFYRNFSPRTQAWINSLGAIVFLLPLCIFTLYISYDFVAQSWAIRESSPEPGGIPAVFLLKSLIPMMALALVLQAIAEVLRNLLLLMGYYSEPIAAIHSLER